MGVFNVAILECDTPIQAVMNERGTYGDIIETFLRRGLEVYSRNSGRSVELRVTKFDVVNFGDFPDPEEVDCVVLSGSSNTCRPEFLSKPILTVAKSTTHSRMMHGF